MPQTALPASAPQAAAIGFVTPDTPEVAAAAELAANPFSDIKPVAEAAAARGLLLLKSGIYSNCIRVLCPLVVSDSELDEALDVWEQALEASLG